MKSATTLWELLFTHQLVSGEMPPIKAVDSPWYVRAILGIAGWIAASFLLLFFAVGFEFLYENHSAGLLVSLLMMGGAWALLHYLKFNDFSEQFAFALSFAGQTLFVISSGIFENLSAGVPFLYVALMEVVLVIVIDNTTHRVWSSLAAILACSIYLPYIHIDLLYLEQPLLLAIVAALWLNEFRFPGYIRMTTSVGYGLTLWLLMLPVFILNEPSMAEEIGDLLQMTHVMKPWMGEALSGIVLLATVYLLVARQKFQLSPRALMAIIGFTAMIALASLKASGISIGVAIILLGFSNSNRILIGMGVISLLGYISSYYYMLQLTLLHKSFTLAATGSVLLAAWLVIRYFTQLNQESSRAN